MFFILSKVLSFLTQPFIWVLLLVICSWIVKNARRKRLLKIIAIFVFFIFSNSFIAGEVMKSWEGRNSDKLAESYAGVIVLGGYSGWNTRHQILEFNESSDRLIHAARLYMTFKAKRIILSGGSGSILKPDEKESALVFDMLREMGIAKIDLLVEDSSRNTYENAIYTSKLIKRTWGAEPNKFILITSAFHMPRAKACFEKTGLDIDYFKVDFHIDDDDYDVGTFIIPSLGAMSTWNLLIKEWLGITAYWFRNFL